MENRTLERIRELVAPIVADLKLDLYDLEFRGGTLRITLDTPPGSEGGVTLDQIALTTRLVGRDLDHHDPIPGHYTLEVTSPGLERSLRTAAHFQREVGKTVNIRLRDIGSAERRVQGVLVAADDHAATVLLDTPAADGSSERIVKYDQVDRARTVFVWATNEKPGKPASNGKATKATKATKADAAPKATVGKAAKSAGASQKPAKAGKKSATAPRTTSRDRRAESRRGVQPGSGTASAGTASAGPANSGTANAGTTLNRTPLNRTEAT